jgi:flagellar hook-associated protein 3 FlgL
MSMTSIGDLAQSFMLRQQHTDLKTRMNSLVQELASGRTSDVSRHLSGSYSYLSDVQRNLTLLEGYDAATGEAILFTDAMQTVLGQFQDSATDLGLASMSAANSKVVEVMYNVSDRAVQDMALMVNALNTEVAGRSLFSGVDSDKTALVSSTEMLDELRTLISGETTLAGIQAKLDTWFEGAGGGFETMAYQGSTTSLPPFRLGAGETVNLDLRADDDSIRLLLKHTAMAALAADKSLGFPRELQEELLMTGGQGLSFQQEGLVRIRADLGYAQARTEESATRIAAERTSYLMARTELLEVDQYEVATQLEDLQYQLEALYSVTVKLSRLSLTDFL